METAPLKSFATWARTALIAEVSARLGVVLAPASSERVEHANAVAELERAIKAAGGGEAGRAAAAEKVAYTWFNRIIALRFMDANGFTGAVGVVSPERGKTSGQPEVLTDAKRGTVDTDVVRPATVAAVGALLNGTRRSADPQGEAFALLLAEYCRHWHTAMPFMFEREGDYTELLIPSNLLADDSVMSRAVGVLTEEVCADVEVIGWLYQFYISERKDEVFAGFKLNKKAGAAEIPAATQLFTPHWIVRYLVENSVGRLWMLNHPESNLIDRMDYYKRPVDDETDFLRIDGPEELTVMDPACGSGHMLTYAFHLLYAIYEEEGYAPSEIPGLILTKNLFGVEIDPRAGALAAFALTMKARERQRTFFSEGVEPNICVLEPISFTDDEIQFLLTPGGDRAEETEFWNQFEHADVFGSLIQPAKESASSLASHLSARSAIAHEDLLSKELLARAGQVIARWEVLSVNYRVAVANPPYMGSANLESKLADFAKIHYPLAKIDLYAMFIERCFEFVDATGTIAMVTQDSWMFLGAYAKYRAGLLSRASLVSLAHLGTSAFDTIGGEVVSTVAFVAHTNGRVASRSTFVRLADVQGRGKAEALSGAASGTEGQRTWVRSTSEFLDIPNSPVIYWASDDELDALRKGPYLSEMLQAREGLTTGNNDALLRRWYEVSQRSIGFSVESTEASVSSGARWFPYQKGGSSRRWFGNFDFVVDWEHDGARARKNIDETTGRVRSHNYNGAFGFKRGLTWSGISGDGFAVRHVEGGFMFDAKGPMAFPNSDDELLVLEAFLNSSAATRFMRLLAPRLDFKLGHVLSLPVRVRENDFVSELASRCISLSKDQWDANEYSAEFLASPLVRQVEQQLTEAVAACHQAEDERSHALAIAEVNLDRFFVEVYFGGHSTEQVVRVRETTSKEPRRRATVEDLVSYAVGCMFGRYSLDIPGLILANQGDTLAEYLAKVPNPSFTPVADNVIPIVDGDWFEDDIVARFREFLRVAFGEEHFEENLRFVTDSLGVKDLRAYFLKSFYTDHVKRYKKRPIYWLFSSPKGSFNALIYMHRYTPSTVSTVLNEYLREYVGKLEASRQHHERLAASGDTPRARAAAQKEVDRLRKVLLELEEYEHDVLYPLATQQIAIDLDDGVKANYPKFGAALKKIPGLGALE